MKLLREIISQFPPTVGDYNRTGVRTQIWIDNKGSSAEYGHHEARIKVSNPDNPSDRIPVIVYFDQQPERTNKVGERLRAVVDIKCAVNQKASLLQPVWADVRDWVKHNEAPLYLWWTEQITPQEAIKRFRSIKGVKVQF